MAFLISKSIVIVDLKSYLPKSNCRLWGNEKDVSVTNENYGQDKKKQ